MKKQLFVLALYMQALYASAQIYPVRAELTDKNSFLGLGSHYSK